MTRHDIIDIVAKGIIAIGAILAIYLTVTL